MKQFSIEADIKTIDGGGFFCLACLTGKPRGYQSEQNPNYCQECYNFLQSDKKAAAELPKDYWSEDGGFIHYLKGYAVIRGGATVCTGSAERTSQDAQGGQEPVTTAKDRETYQPVNVTADIDNVTARCRALSGEGLSTRQIAEALKQEGINISHMTAARRLQGTLL